MTEPKASGPGDRLRATREGMEVSPREVADALNLPVRVIEALEADDYERLPPTVFTRGYLRSYARLLELPQDELLALYPNVEPEPEAATETASEPVQAFEGKTLLIAGAALVAVIVLLIWMFTGDGPESEPAVVLDTIVPAPGEGEPTAPEASATQAPASGAGEPEAGTRGLEPETLEPEMLERGVPGEGSEAPGLAESIAPAREVPSEPAAGTGSGTDAPDVPVTPEPAAIEPADERVPAVSRRERRITELGDDQLVFTFSEDCWLEVKSADGENLYSDLNRAGRTLVLTGAGPFRILLGYAPGVSLSFNGSSIALDRHTRNNVANLVLGE